MKDLQDDLRLVAEWVKGSADTPLRVKEHCDGVPVLSDEAKWVDYFLTGNGMVALMDHMQGLLGSGHVTFCQTESGFGVILVPSRTGILGLYLKGATRQEALVRAIAKMLRAEK